MSKLKSLNREVSWGRVVNLTQKAVLAKHLSIMLNAGLTVVESLSVAIDSTTGRLQKILKRVKQSVESGTALSVALERHGDVFAGVFINAIYAGERSGNLAVNLSELSSSLEKERNLRAKVKSAMIYPAIVFFATIVLGLVIAFFILPKLTPLFLGLNIALPWTTRALIWIANFVDNFGLITLVAAIVVVLLLRWSLRLSAMVPISHWVTLHLPAFGRMSAKLNLARLAGTMGLLLKSGVRIDEAITVTQKTIGNYYFKQSLARAAADLDGGAKLSESLAKNPALFPPLFTRLIGVGEVSGQFEETFFYLAEFYEEEVDAEAKRLSTALEPILLLIIGLVVGGLALSIITPIYELTGNVRGS